MEEASLDLDKLRVATMTAQNDALARFIDKMEQGLLILNSSGSTHAAASPRSPPPGSKPIDGSEAKRASSLNFEARRKRREKKQSVGAKDTYRLAALDESILCWQAGPFYYHPSTSGLTPFNAVQRHL